MSFSALADTIFSVEFDSNSGIASTEKIEAWLESNVGQLSARLAECYTGDGSYLNAEQSAIYSQMYLSSYYGKAAQSANSGVGTSSAATDWISIREGDSSVTRTNKNEVAKSYLSIKKDINTELDKLITAYLIKYATAQQVAGDDVTSYPY